MPTAGRQGPAVADLAADEALPGGAAGARVVSRMVGDVRVHGCLAADLDRLETPGAVVTDEELVLVRRGALAARTLCRTARARRATVSVPVRLRGADHIPEQRPEAHRRLDGRGAADARDRDQQRRGEPTGDADAPAEPNGPALRPPRHRLDELVARLPAARRAAPARSPRALPCREISPVP